MSCLFDSLIAVGRVPETAQQMRIKLVDHILDQANLYRKHIEAESGESVADYCRRMRAEHTMGDYTMIVASCRVYNWAVRIVFKNTQREHLVEIFPNTPRVICVAYTPGHYSPLFRTAVAVTPTDRFKPV